MCTDEQEGSARTMGSASQRMAWSQEITQSTYGDRTSEERIYIPRDSTREKVRVVFREFQLARRRLRSRSGGRAGPQTVRKAVGTVSQRTSRRSHSKSFLRVTSGPREARVSGARSAKQAVNDRKLFTATSWRRLVVVSAEASADTSRDSPVVATTTGAS